MKKAVLVLLGLLLLLGSGCREKPALPSSRIEWYTDLGWGEIDLQCHYQLHCDPGGGYTLAGQFDFPGDPPDPSAAYDSVGPVNFLRLDERGKIVRRVIIPKTRCYRVEKIFPAPGGNYYLVLEYRSSKLRLIKFLQLSPRGRILAQAVFSCTFPQAEIFYRLDDGHLSFCYSGEAKQKFRLKYVFLDRKFNVTGSRFYPVEFKLSPQAVYTREGILDFQAGYVVKISPRGKIEWRHRAPLSHALVYEIVPLSSGGWQVFWGDKREEEDLEFRYCRTTLQLENIDRQGKRLGLLNFIFIQHLEFIHILPLPRGKALLTGLPVRPDPRRKAGSVVENPVIIRLKDRGIIVSQQEWENTIFVYRLWAAGEDGFLVSAGYYKDCQKPSLKERMGSLRLKILDFYYAGYPPPAEAENLRRKYFSKDDEYGGCGEVMLINSPRIQLLKLRTGTH